MADLGHMLRDGSLCPAPYPRPGAAPDGDASRSDSRPCRCWRTCARARPNIDLDAGFAIGATTVFRQVPEALNVIAALTPTPTDAIQVPAGKAFVILDGTLLPIDRVG